VANLKVSGREIQRLESEKLPPMEVSRFQAALEELKSCATPGCRPPAEMALKMEGVGLTKANGNVFTISLLGILAGFFIGLGAMFCTLVTTDIQVGFGLSKLLGGIVFFLGIFLVVL